MNECLIFFPRFGRTRVLDAAAALTPLAFGWGCQDGFVRDGCKVWGCFRVFSSPLTAQYAPNKQTNKQKEGVTPVHGALFMLPTHEKDLRLSRP